MLDGNTKAYQKSYNFAVFFGRKKVSFQKISGLSAGAEFEALREGGRNTVVYSLRNQDNAERTITLERGLSATEKEFSDYQPGTRYKDDVIIVSLNDRGIPMKAYYLTGCVIRRLSIGEMNASGSGLVIASMELGFETMEEDKLSAALVSAVKK